MRSGFVAMFRRAALVAAALLAMAAAQAEDYLPAGALTYTEERLPNGLRLVIQRVHSAPYLSLRLVARTGSDHYPCQDRELPHLVEHLLFSANAALAEHEIDDRVVSWGGHINAFTYPEQTVVVLDAHSRFQRDAIELLATMVRDFDPQDEDVAREANVVERESGVDHTPSRLWWSRQPAMQLASTKFDIAAGLRCTAGLTPVHHLTAQAVRSAFDTYYVPANMVLVLVGDLDDNGIAAARAAFATLPARPLPRLAPLTIAQPAQDTFTSGWLSGTAGLDAPTAAGIVPFRDWQGYYALQLVQDWLGDRMFRELRSERGITYTPSAQVSYEGSAMLVTLQVETSPADTGFAMDYLQELANEVRAGGISREEFEHLRRASLLGMAQSFERIADRADYLADSMREIDAGGLFDVETFYEQLTWEQFQALVARDWPPRFAVMDASPRVSWSAWIALLLGSAGLLAGAVGLRLWQRWRRLRDAHPG